MIGEIRFDLLESMFFRFAEVGYSHNKLPSDAMDQEFSSRSHQHARVATLLELMRQVPRVPQVLAMAVQVFLGLTKSVHDTAAFRAHRALAPCTGAALQIAAATENLFLLEFQPPRLVCPTSISLPPSVPSRGPITSVICPDSGLNRLRKKLRSTVLHE